MALDREEIIEGICGKRPTFPYRNVEEAQAGMQCPTCNGSKWVPRHGELIDPVEGYKMADKVQCPMCSSETMLFVAKGLAYQNDRAAFMKKLRHWFQKTARVREVMGKLTDEDILTLRLTSIRS